MHVRLAAALALLAPLSAIAQAPTPAPWMNAALPPERRTALLLGAMTRDEKLAQLTGAPGIIPELPQCYGARHVAAIPRLKIPTFRITNGPVGVGQSDCVPATGSNAPTGALMTRDAPKATALPSGMAVAA